MIYDIRRIIERVAQVRARGDFPTVFRADLAASGFEIIEPDGKTYRAFSQRQWSLDSFLARKGGVVYVALVNARHAYRGYFSKLVEEIEEGGAPVAVIMPLGPLEAMVERQGWDQGRMLIGMEAVTVWLKPQKKS